jgi:hypothetical protein
VDQSVDLGSCLWINQFIQDIVCGSIADQSQLI